MRTGVREEAGFSPAPPPAVLSDRPFRVRIPGDRPAWFFCWEQAGGRAVPCQVYSRNQARGFAMESAAFAVARECGGTVEFEGDDP